MINNYMIFKNLPTLDLHGCDRYQAKILTTEFINDNYKLKNKLIIIIHGKGQNILKNEIYNVLKTNKLIKEYKLDIFTGGSTIIELK